MFKIHQKFKRLKRRKAHLIHKGGRCSRGGGREGEGSFATEITNKPVIFHGRKILVTKNCLQSEEPKSLCYFLCKSKFLFTPDLSLSLLASWRHYFPDNEYICSKLE